MAARAESRGGRLGTGGTGWNRLRVSSVEAIRSPRFGPRDAACTIVATLFRSRDRLIDQMLIEKPDLQFVGPQHIAYEHIVGSVVAERVGALRKLAHKTDNQLVCVHET